MRVRQYYYILSIYYYGMTVTRKSIEVWTMEQGTYIYNDK